jgi:phosphomannomutase
VTLIKSISGIRGTIGGKSSEALTPLDIVKFTSAYSAWILAQGNNKKVVIGRDARISGEMVAKLVAATLQGMGLEVLDLGLSTTPTVEIAVTAENAAGGIILTASHNPAQWNALKLLNHKGEFISEADGAWILQSAESQNFSYANVSNLGIYKQNNTYIQKHIDMILELPLVDKKAIQSRNFKIIVDAVNSTGGIAVPMLLRALGVEQITELFCEPNGNFPHNPEPLPEHLSHIISRMESRDFDLGIVVDPDVDRLAFVCEDGTPFGEEYTLVAIADYVLQHTKGNTVSNLSSTRALRDVTTKWNGNYYASAVGEVNVVTTMKEVKAVIGGEGNGGVIFPELHYGRDALVGIALFLTHLAKTGKSTKMLRMSYPNYHISKNKIELTAEINVDAILEGIEAKYSKQTINKVDGLKIDFENEWVHLRKSNTEPIIRIYSESESAATAEYLAQKIISDIKELITK